MLAQHRRGDRVRLVLLPMRALHRHDVDTGLAHRVFEAKPALLRVERRRNALEDRGLVAPMKMRRERGPDRPRAGAVIRSDERDLDADLLKRGGVELVVDVHDDNVLHEAPLRALARAPVNRRAR